MEGSRIHEEVETGGTLARRDKSRCFEAVSCGNPERLVRVHGNMMCWAPATEDDLL